MDPEVQQFVIGQLLVIGRLCLRVDRDRLREVSKCCEAYVSLGLRCIPKAHALVDPRQT